MTMGRFFIAQSSAILLLIYVQEHIEEGSFSYDAAGQALNNFSFLFVISIILSALIAFIRKKMQPGLDFKKATIKMCTFILPVYYVIQFLGWLVENGYLPGS